jgi:hypothetical protein
MTGKRVGVDADAGMSGGIVRGKNTPPHSADAQLNLAAHSFIVAACLIATRMGRWQAPQPSEWHINVPIIGR